MWNDYKPGVIREDTGSTINDDLLTDEEKALLKQIELDDKKYQIISEIERILKTI